jgi:hypothetical protein
MHSINYSTNNSIHLVRFLSSQSAFEWCQEIAQAHFGSCRFIPVFDKKGPFAPAVRSLLTASFAPFHSALNFCNMSQNTLLSPNPLSSPLRAIQEPFDGIQSIVVHSFRPKAQIQHIPTTCSFAMRPWQDQMSEEDNVLLDLMVASLISEGVVAEVTLANNRRGLLIPSSSHPSLSSSLVLRVIESSHHLSSVANDNHATLISTSFSAAQQMPSLASLASQLTAVIQHTSPTVIPYSISSLPARVEAVATVAQAIFAPAAMDTVENALRNALQTTTDPVVTQTLKELLGEE